MTVENMSKEQVMLAEHACARLLNQFASNNDAGRFDEMSELFSVDGRFARPIAPDSFTEGRQAIKESFQSRFGERVSRHLLSNIVVTVLSPEKATGHCYATLYTGSPENKVELGIKANPSQFIGEYIVDFNGTEDGWKIAQLTGEITFTT